MTTTASSSSGDGATDPTSTSASQALHDALEDLHRAEEAAWQRYATDLEEATHRLDAALADVAARLGVETSPSHRIADSLAAVRGEAEHSLSAARERVQHTVDEVGRAFQDFGRGLRTP